MAGRIFHPETKHPEPYQKDLGPDASKGLNFGNEGPPIPTRNAHEIKELHEKLADFTPEELRQIRVLCEGVRLETGAAYVNLADPDRKEIHAKGDEVVDWDDLFVAKKDVPYELWNRLLGIDDARRTAGPG